MGEEALEANLQIGNPKLIVYCVCTVHIKQAVCTLLPDVLVSEGLVFV